MLETAGGGRCPAPRPPAGRACPQLLGSAMAATAALSYFGPHFAVIGPVSADRTTYEALRHGGVQIPALQGTMRAGPLQTSLFLSTIFLLETCHPPQTGPIPPPEYWFFSGNMGEETLHPG